MDIKETLLAIGGDKVEMPESVPDTLYRFGHIYNFEIHIPQEGASKYFLEHEKEVRVLWGFVLDDEGIWKMHSWLINRNEMVIIDNCKYKKYYGFIKESNGVPV